MTRNLVLELKYDTVNKKNNALPGRAGHWDLHLTVIPCIILINWCTCGYANVLHTSSSFRLHTHTHHTIWGPWSNRAKSFLFVFYSWEEILTVKTKIKKCLAQAYNVTLFIYTMTMVTIHGLRFLLQICHHGKIYEIREGGSRLAWSLCRPQGYNCKGQ